MVKLYQNMDGSEKAFSGEEPLLISAPNNSNVIYNKGLIKMHELYLLIGEEKINKALKNLLSKHRFPYQSPTTIDLVYKLKSISRNENHDAIDKIFKE